MAFVIALPTILNITFESVCKIYDLLWSDKQCRLIEEIINITETTTNLIANLTSIVVYGRSANMHKNPSLFEYIIINLYQCKIYHKIGHDYYNLCWLRETYGPYVAIDHDNLGYW